MEACSLGLGAELRKTDPTAENPPTRSIISKLSTLGVYEKKQYLTKRGEIPVRKAEYIEKIARILEVDVETLESAEKLNKNVLILLLAKLESFDPRVAQKQLPSGAEWVQDAPTGETTRTQCMSSTFKALYGENISLYDCDTQNLTAVATNK